MRSVPDDVDKDEVARLNAQAWMLDLLALNPDYNSWGPHEDYMWKEGDGWDSRVIHESWTAFGPWELDDMNECVNFYFSVNRDSKQCEACGQSGLNQATKRIADSFYDHGGRAGRWCDAITQDEVQALLDANRLHRLTHRWVQGDGWVRNEPPAVPTAEQVNAMNRNGGMDSHGAINRWILVEARAKRLGVYGKCAECGGHGEVFTAPAAHVSLTLWMLHPRKGCSRGVEVSRIEQDELPAVFAWLRSAAERNADRFSKIK